MSSVALLHPGSMGARVGGELVRAGHDVRWLRPDRSPATATRAGDERLTAVDDVSALLEGTEVVLSVCPPQGALDVARMVAGTGFSGAYLEANPVSASTLSAVADVVQAAGADVVDGGIVGPPPREGHRTHLYLAGPPGPVAAVEQLFGGTAVTPVVVGPDLGQASAAKQAYALANKGRMVLVSLAADLARAHGVERVLEGESVRPGNELLADLDDLHDGLAATGWRWAPELDEISDSLTAAGLDATAVRGLADRLRALSDREG